MLPEEEKKMTEKTENKKTPMTDEERLALAAKLDKDLDDFINNLPKKKYEDGWPEDRWEEEMDKHPFFMKKAPEPGAELHPLYEGLQKLKYDPDENEPEDLAIAYKDDGNFNFKHKNYRLAIMAYTEGIKVKCGNSDIEANLLNNRAAAHYFLKNYRSCLLDCEKALQLNSTYKKAITRAANCCFNLNRYSDCIEYCNRLLEINKDDSEALVLKNKARTAEKTKDRDERKQKFKERKEEDRKKALVEAIKKRGIRIEGAHITLDKIESHVPGISSVYLDEHDNLIWPVIVLFPEYKTMDYVNDCSELLQVSVLLQQIFEKPAEWDEEHKYSPGTVNVYFETDKQKVVKINVEQTLEEVMKMKGYVVKGGTPSFIILAANSPAEKHFLKAY